jgi:hypothetical protein
VRRRQDMGHFAAQMRFDAVSGEMTRTLVKGPVPRTREWLPIAGTRANFGPASTVIFA